MKKPQTKDAELQGEGNYTAARRHRRANEAFVKSGQVADAAKKAAPKDEEEAQALREAVQAGREKARR